jgi:hypothetical protein
VKNRKGRRFNLGNLWSNHNTIKMQKENKDSRGRDELLNP